MIRFTCPSCNGQLEIDSGDEAKKCPLCNTPLDIPKWKKSIDRQAMRALARGYAAEMRRLQKNGESTKRVENAASAGLERIVSEFPEHERPELVKAFNDEWKIIAAELNSMVGSMVGRVLLGCLINIIVAGAIAAAWFAGAFR
jgi:hypothetical protein